MKLFNTLSHVFAVGGILLIFYAVIGRFCNEQTVFGNFIEGGMAAHSVMIGANTLLLLAILSNFYKEK